MPPMGDEVVGGSVTIGVVGHGRSWSALNSG